MHQPPIDDLIRRTDSKYALVAAASKRARALTEGAEPMTRKTNAAGLFKPVSIALDELASGKLVFEAPNSGIK